MGRILSPRKRLEEIIEISYSILRNKIACGNIDVKNEASFQMQFGVILKQVGQLYEFADADKFSIELEEVKRIKASQKSANGVARCDISLGMSDGKERAKAFIELKYFKQCKSAEAVASNRFAVMLDIQNLERYKDDTNPIRCEILFTTNKNYANPETSAGVKLAPAITRNFTYRGRTVNLEADYAAEWDMYDNKYFMKVKF